MLAKRQVRLFRFWVIPTSLDVKRLHLERFSKLTYYLSHSALETCPSGRAKESDEEGALVLHEEGRRRSCASADTGTHAEVGKRLGAGDRSSDADSDAGVNAGAMQTRCLACARCCVACCGSPQGWEDVGVGS